MGVVLAFYKGKGDWLDWLIRLFTRSQYSHVEYVQDSTAMDDQGRHECWSSSFRDGGVRAKPILLKDDKWDLVLLTWFDEDQRLLFALRKGEKYDYLGILFSQVLPFHIQRNGQWFCSEIVADVLSLKAPESYSPGRLKRAIDQLNARIRSLDPTGKKKFTLSAEFAS